jgi:hypothetical protein
VPHASLANKDPRPNAEEMKPIVRRLGRLVETMEPNYPYYIGDRYLDFVGPKRNQFIMKPYRLASP